MKPFLIFLFLSAGFLQAQTRYIISVRGEDNFASRIEEELLRIQNPVLVFQRERGLQRPDLGINILAFSTEEREINRVENILSASQFQRNFIFTEEPRCRLTSGLTTSGGIVANPTVPNLPLDDLVPQEVITPLQGALTADVLVDIMGTGIDQQHPALSGLHFEPPLSVILTGSGTLPGDFDYHDHETRIAGCIAGRSSGLLTRLGTRQQARYRSVLFYDQPSVIGPVAYLTDCLAAVAEILDQHDQRTDVAYLKNHAAVVCFAHSLESPNTRVGALDIIFEQLWEAGIFTSISAGNDAIAAAAISPAGSGEWISYHVDGTPTSPVSNTNLWPPTGSTTYTTYDLPTPSTTMVGFQADFMASDYHIKSGAQNCGPIIGLWHNSNQNTSNPLGLGTPTGNTGVDLIAPGENINFPSTEIQATSTAIPDVVINGTGYLVERGYRTGSGSSYSAAFTAALATRILQLRPWASPSQIREVILNSTTPANSYQSLTIPNFNNLPAMALSYARWIARYNQIADAGPFPTGLGTKMDDPDQDGVVNLVEYFCGMDPRIKDDQHAPTLRVNQNFSQLTVKMQLAEYLDSTNEVDWELQVSEDLENWVGIGKGLTTLAAETPSNGDGRNLTATLDITGENDIYPKRFYRVRVFTTP